MGNRGTLTRFLCASFSGSTLGHLQWAHEDDDMTVGGGWCGKWAWVVVVSGCGGGVWCVVVVACVARVHEKFVFGVWLDHVFCLPTKNKFFCFWTNHVCLFSLP